MSYPAVNASCVHDHKAGTCGAHEPFAIASAPPYPCIDADDWNILPHAVHIPSDQCSVVSRALTFCLRKAQQHSAALQAAAALCSVLSTKAPPVITVVVNNSSHHHYYSDRDAKM